MVGAAGLDGVPVRDTGRREGEGIGQARLHLHAVLWPTLVHAWSLP